MPTFAFYLLKVVLCSAVLFGYYQLFLRNKVYHAYNRFYLLAIVVIALLAPVINFNYLFTGGTTVAKPIQLLQVVTSSDEYLEEVILYSHQNFISLSQLLMLLYVIVSLVLLFALVKVIVQIVHLLKTNSSKYINDVVFVESNAKGTPFSFFKFIFWNNAIDIHSETGQQIFAHELAHVREKHSADKLFLNIVLVFCWINPIFWLIKKELNLIHEFIADKKAVANNDASALAAMIVTSAYPKHAYLLTNHFFYSPIKRRLQMLSKYNTKSSGYFYRILALPVVLFFLAAFTIKTKGGIENIINPANKITVVIDAGHGGHDAGATGLDGSHEKDINLAFVKRIKELNQSANIELVFTRETDIYQSPQEKAAIAKKFGADLFISVHASSGPFSTATKNGMEVFVSKDEHANSQASKLFASAVIAHFKNNYGLAVPSLPMQRKIGIHVLQANDCPSILIEAGYVSNKQDLAYLQTNKAKDDFARNVLAAISQYAANRNSQTSTSVLTKQADTLDLPKNSLSKDKEKKEGLLEEFRKTDASQRIQKNMVDEPSASNNKSYPFPNVVVEENGFSVTTNSLALSSQPLVILDGVEIAYSDLNKVNVKNVESMNVLKGKEAIKKYGAEKTANGVIEIIQKKGGRVTESVAPDEGSTLPEKIIFTKLEQEATFPGGSTAWLKYLKENLNANMPVDEGWSAGTFKVIVKFVVSADGSISDVVAENYVGSKTAQMCVDFIKNGPKWIPGRQNNLAVTSLKKQPITFVIQEE